MSAQYVIEILAEGSITIRLDGDDLLVNYKQPLTDEDVHFIKSHKPELVEYLQSQPAPLVDEFGRRQCADCKYWANKRCNHRHFISRNDFGRPTYYTPNPLIWMRCEFHSEED